VLASRFDANQSHKIPILTRRKVTARENGLLEVFAAAVAIILLAISNMLKAVDVRFGSDSDLEAT